MHPNTLATSTLPLPEVMCNPGGQVTAATSPALRERSAWLPQRDLRMVASKASWSGKAILKDRQIEHDRTSHSQNIQNNLPGFAKVSLTFSELSAATTTSIRGARDTCRDSSACSNACRGYSGTQLDTQTISDQSRLKRSQRVCSCSGASHVSLLLLFSFDCGVCDDLPPSETTSLEFLEKLQYWMMKHHCKNTWSRFISYRE